MATALDLITRAMRLLQVYSIGEAPTADEGQTGLFALNALMDSIPNSRLMVFDPSTDVVSLPVGMSSYQVGPSGSALVTTRPVEVLAASTVSYQGVDYPLTVLTLDDYARIPVKATQGIPRAIYVDPSFPNVTIYVYPVPAVACTLNLQSFKQVQSFSDLNTSVVAPPGYEQMLCFMLAESLAPEFAVEVPAQVAREAARARRAIKRTNTSIPRLQTPYGVPTGSTYYNWRIV